MFPISIGGVYQLSPPVSINAEEFVQRMARELARADANDIKIYGTKVTFRRLSRRRFRFDPFIGMGRGEVDFRVGPPTAVRYHVSYLPEFIPFSIMVLAVGTIGFCFPEAKIWLIAVIGWMCLYTLNYLMATFYFRSFIQQIVDKQA